MLLDKVKSYINNKALLSTSTTILVGVSGGADSMALLEILHRLKYTCFVAHMNFSLRGDESDEDEVFVRKHALQLKIPFFSKKVDTLKYAKTKGISMEMAARELRYTFFEELLKQHKIDVVAVGHHKNDLVETMLINLTRGTGVRGLSGIQPKMGTIIRPLLDVTNKEILEFSTTNNIPYRIDRTNTDTDIQRNNFRHTIIPKLEAINPSFTQTMADTAHRMQQVQALINDVVRNFNSQFVTENNGKKYIQLNALLKDPSHAILLFEILSPFGFNSSQLDEVNNALGKTPGKSWKTNTHRLILSATHLILQEKIVEPVTHEITIEAKTREIATPFTLQISENLPIKDCTLNYSNERVFFDAEKISYPLQLRKWKHGDWFMPFGMTGRKKLSDFFIDNKLSMDEKEEVFVLLSGDNIIWIPGYRTDERYKITAKTEFVIRIHLTKPKD